MARIKPVTIYGIKNCDTMKKARAWLDAHGIAYAFHDYKAAGIERARLESWVREVGWETLINRAGTTFRKLPEKDRDGLTQRKAIALMLGQPSVIKRPVLDVDAGCSWASSRRSMRKRCADQRLRTVPPSARLIACAMIMAIGLLTIATSRSSATSDCGCS
jgi:arsenate reductase (glutaredoxin)